MAEAGAPDAVGAGDNSPAYNRIFGQLVDTPEGEQQRLIGLIAYSLYKEAKREWIANFRAQNRRRPTDAEVAAYTTYWTDGRIAGLRQEAASILAAFAEAIVSDAQPRILKDALRVDFGAPCGPRCWRAPSTRWR